MIERRELTVDLQHGGWVKLAYTIDWRAIDDDDAAFVRSLLASLKGLDIAQRAAALTS